MNGKDGPLQEVGAMDVACSHKGVTVEPSPIAPLLNSFSARGLHGTSSVVCKRTSVHAEIS